MNPVTKSDVWLITALGDEAGFVWPNTLVVRSPGYIAYYYWKFVKLAYSINAAAATVSR